MNTGCTAVQEILQRRLDGETLGQADDSMLRAHLATCVGCRAFAQDLERVTGLVERLAEEPAPQGFAANVMARLPQAQRLPEEQPHWQALLRRQWAPLAGLAGVLILAYQAVSVHGLSLLNMPGAVAEWAAMIDLGNVESLLQATSLFAWTVDAELVLGMSLVIVSVFAMMAQVMARPPALGAPRPEGRNYRVGFTGGTLRPTALH